MKEGLGDVFRDEEDKETFEVEFTDISDFAPFMSAMVEWKLVTIIGKNDRIEPTKIVLNTDRVTMRGTLEAKDWADLLVDNWQ